jgi:single-strand DNA-binding protein
MNVITLTGNAVKDIEIRFTPSGKGIANGTIAVRRDFKNQNGEYETDFINFIAIGGLSEVMANHVKKGDKFGITGRLQIRKWQKDNGETQYFTEVVANGFDFPSKAQGNTNVRQSQKNANNGQNGGYTRTNDDPFSGQGQIDVSSDDLPF